MTKFVGVSRPYISESLGFTFLAYVVDTRLWVVCLWVQCEPLGSGVVQCEPFRNGVPPKSGGVPPKVGEVLLGCSMVQCIEPGWIV